MTWLVFGLFATAIAVLVAAEWPRLLGRLSRAPLVGRYSARKRRRRRERAHLVLVEDDESDELAEDREAFAESVVRDLERLPTIDDRD
ncbi:MAG: hypothetical protein WBQ14_10070 [Gaiellaceae bacterium]